MKRKIIPVTVILLLALVMASAAPARAAVYTRTAEIQESQATAIELGNQIQEAATSQVIRIINMEAEQEGEKVLPLDFLRVTSGFGPRWGSFHNGVDFGIEEGTPVYAAKDGQVIYAGYNGSYGYLIKVDHGGGEVTWYAHCRSLLAEENTHVKAGQAIAESGSTGNSTGPHLHFEVRINNIPENPLEWLDIS